MSRFPKERFKLICIICGSGFEVVKSRLGKAKFCSNECRTKASRVNDKTHQCGCCGEEIEETANHRDQINRRGAKNFFCSRECFYSFSLVKLPIGSMRKSPTTGYIFIKIKHDRWIAEHRLIAWEHIGRELFFDSEPILHIDGRHDNNSPNNLYICINQGEINTILKSYKAPYPVIGNLDCYTGHAV
jgi:YHS domain-containing protein